MILRRILITGGEGMLASDLAAQLRRRPQHEVIVLPHGRLDVTKGQQVREAIAAHHPDVIINTAALHVEDCEAAPEQAYGVNGWGARNLARASEEHRSILVHISTGGVFGDEVRAYHEYDAVVLKTVYARSKYAGEEFVRLFCERHFIVRLGWLYGGAVSQRKNFVVARYREAAQHPVIYSAADKHGSPTYTGDVAEAIAALIESGEYGLYHLANQGGCTRAQYVRLILQTFGLPTHVEDVDSGHFPRRAPVPDCEILTSFNLGYAGLPALPPWQDALVRYISSIRNHVS